MYQSGTISLSSSTTAVTFPVVTGQDVLLEAVHTNLLSGAGKDGIGVHFSGQQLRDGDNCSTLLDVKKH